MRALRPDYVFSGGRTLSGVSLLVQDGVVQGVESLRRGRTSSRFPGVPCCPEWWRRTAMPSSAHPRPDRSNRAHDRDDFWTWREAMYAAAEQLTPEELYAVSKVCFLEMARAGITAVGEFHYLHRDPAGKPYADPNELDLAVARAAREAGLRIILLRVAYARSGFRIPENPRQKRFIEGSVDEYLRNLDALSRHVPSAPLPTACAPARRNGSATSARRRSGAAGRCTCTWPSSEEKSSSARPSTAPRPRCCSKRRGVLRERPPRCTQSISANATSRPWAARGLRLRLSTTERNLGDGVVRADLLLAAGARLCIGSDSEVQLSPLEDARQLEYHLRLLQSRGRSRPGARGCGRPGREALRKSRAREECAPRDARGRAPARRAGGFHRRRPRRSLDRRMQRGRLHVQRGIRDGADRHPRDLGGRRAVAPGLRERAARLPDRHAKAVG